MHDRLVALLRPKNSKSAEIVEDLPIPVDPPLPAVLDSEDAPDSKQVLDSLIAVLRHEYTRSLKENDLDSSEVNQAAAALAESYQQRADMIYLRPAMAYLRTSFTATTLQDNRLAWQNLLSNHGLRSGIPFVPEWIAEERARVTEELDKQFWHSINRVRVAGAGDTNYAIVKDDLGNWYVKSYSTDVKDIINSARNLGMFAAGVPNFEVTSPTAPTTPGAGAANDNLPQVTTGEGGEPPVESTPATEEDTPDTKKLSKQHQLFADKFGEQTYGSLTQVKAIASTLPGRLQSAWSAAKFSADQLSALEGIAVVEDSEPLSKDLLDLKLDEQKTTLHADQLVAGLRAIKLYHDRVARGVYRLPPKEEEASGLTNAQRRRASQIVADVVLVQALKPLLTEGVSSADQYETALQIIGQVSGL